MPGGREVQNHYFRRSCRASPKMGVEPRPAPRPPPKKKEMAVTLIKPPAKFLEPHVCGGVEEGGVGHHTRMPLVRGPLRKHGPLHVLPRGGGGDPGSGCCSPQ